MTAGWECGARPARRHPPVQPLRERFGRVRQPVGQDVRGLDRRARVVGDQDQQEAGVAGDHVGGVLRVGGACVTRPAICRVTCAAAFRGGGVPGRVRPGAQRHRDSSPAGEHAVVGHRGHARALPGQGQQPAAAPAETCAVPRPAASASAQPSSTPAVPE